MPLSTILESAEPELDDEKWEEDEEFDTGEELDLDEYEEDLDEEDDALGV
jgi:hypothetical protein